MLSNGFKIRIKKVTMTDLIGWLPVLFYLANLYRMTGHSAAPYIVTAVIAGIPGLYRAVLHRGKICKPAIVTLGLFFITGFINYLFIGNLTVIDVALEILFIGMAFTMLFYPATFFQGAVCFYTTAAFFIAAYLTGKNTLLLLESSRNYISVLLILSCSFYYCALENTDKRFRVIDLIPATLCFLLSVWAYGRGGILACAFMLGLVAACWTWCYSNGDAEKKVLVVGIIIIVACYLFFSNISIIDSFMNLGKWKENGGSSDDRLFIWGSYMNKAGESLIYILFGVPLDQVPILQHFRGNTHNSFIQLHAFNGVVTFVLFSVCSIKTLFREIRNKYYLHAILLAIIVLRGMTDKFIFGQYGMPVVMYLVLHPFFERRSQNTEEVCHA